MNDAGDGDSGGDDDGERGGGAACTTAKPLPQPPVQQSSFDCRPSRCHSIPIKV